MRLYLVAGAVPRAPRRGAGSRTLGGGWGDLLIAALFAILQVIGLRRYQATQRVGPGVPVKAES